MMEQMYHRMTDKQLPIQFLSRHDEMAGMEYHFDTVFLFAGGLHLFLNSAFPLLTVLSKFCSL